MENGTLHEHTGPRGGSSANVVLEEHLSQRPSRKSTRKSANGQKSAEQGERRRQMVVGIPAQRHQRRGA